MSKEKAIEYENVEALSYVGDIYDVNNYESRYYEMDRDKIELEKLIYFLSPEETSILVLKHIGYKPQEIYKIMGLQSVKVYYKLYRSLKMRIYLYKKVTNNQKAV